MKIGVAGCSNSSDSWGEPWHYYMGKKYNAEIVASSSCGAGNEMNIEKVRYILENNKPDLFVFQLTEPSRMVLGLSEDGLAKNILDRDGSLHDTNKFGEAFYYTFNGHQNNINVGNLYGTTFDIDKFLVNKSFNSKYNTDIKVFHTMMTIQYLCNIHNVKLIFFSWFMDINQLSKDNGFDYITKDMYIIPGYVFDYTNQNNIQATMENNHFDTESQEKIFENYINPYLQTLI